MKLTNDDIDRYQRWTDALNEGTYRYRPPFWEEAEGGETGNEYQAPMERGWTDVPMDSDAVDQDGVTCSCAGDRG